MSAQLPVARLSTLFPPGGKAGTSLEVQLTGVDLDDVTQLHFSHPAIRAKRKAIAGTSQTPAHGFLIEVATNVPPGVYEARAIGRFGISNPRAFMVGDLPESVEKEPNDSASAASEVQLGAITYGHAEPSTADYFKFKARKGQRILLGSFTREIDSRMDGVLVLYDSGGRELERNRRGGLLDFTAPVEGEFIVKTHDFLYRGGEEYFYRLSIGAGPHIDFVLPPAGLPGSKSKYILFGRNLPGSTPAQGLTIEGKALEQLAVEFELPADAAARYPLSARAWIRPADLVVDGVGYRLVTTNGVSNPVLIGFATAPLVVEQPSNDKPETAQKVSVPCEYVGQYYPRDDRDWISFEAKKGEVYWIEIFSERLGLPADPFVLVQRLKKESGEQSVDVQELYDSDVNIGGPEYNTATRDPTWRFEVQEDGTYRIQTRDLFNKSQSNPSLVYRLSIRKEAPDFRLLAFAQPPPPQNKDKKEALVWTPFLRRGETMPIKVLAFRRDQFNDAIELSVEGLPPGVSCAGAKLEPGAASTLVFLTASEEAAGWVGVIKVVGKAKIGNAEVVREARGGSIAWTVGDYNNEPVQSRITGDFVLAVSGQESAPISLEAAEKKIWETSWAGKLTIPIKLVRRGEFKETVKLKAAGLPALDPMKEMDVSAQTNTAALELDLTQIKLPVGTHTFHIQAQTKGKYRPVTPEEAKAAEMAVKEADEAVKKFEKEATELGAAAKQAAEAKKEAALQVAKAAKEASQKAQWKDLTVSTYSTPVHLKVVAAPINLSAQAPSTPLEPGAKIEVPVTIQRLYGYREPVELSLVAPKEANGLSATRVTIPKDQNETKVVVEAKPDAKPGDYTLTLQATLKLNNQDLKVDQTLALKVGAIAKTNDK